ncbi:MAG: type IX secretion system membrane protein PorP/SprF [Flavobacteriales bacterium]|nr:type IX secretion system membrane protein PorP/SprF [Flavobacteriales bacterium]
MMRVIWIILLLCSISAEYFGQQLSQYSQYQYSLFVINPAYAGNKDKMQGLITERRQWVGIEGAPHTQSLNFHTPFSNRKMGAGLSVYNETIGAHGTISAFGSYSYSIRTTTSSLSFGLRAGFYSYRINESKVDYRDENDPSALTNVQSNFVPTFDFGMHYYKGNFMAGFSAMNLLESEISLADNNIETNNLKRHAFVYTGYVFTLSEKWKFQPTVLGKLALNAPVNIDFNTSFIYDSKFGFGVSYRTNKAIVAMVQMWFAKNLRLGYSFDYEIGLMQSTTISGSHELFFGIDINKKNASVVNPRFL